MHWLKRGFITFHGQYNQCWSYFMKMVKRWLQFPSCKELPMELRRRLSSVLLHHYILMYFLILCCTATQLDYTESVWMIQRLTNCWCEREIWTCLLKEKKKKKKRSLYWLSFINCDRAYKSSFRIGSDLKSMCVRMLREELRQWTLQHSGAVAD